MYREMNVLKVSQNKVFVRINSVIVFSSFYSAIIINALTSKQFFNEKYKWRSMDGWMEDWVVSGWEVRKTDY